MSGPPVIQPPVRLRARLVLRLGSLAAAAAAVAGAVLAARGQSPREALAFGLAVLCIVVAVVAWWGEVAIDSQRIAVRVPQRDHNQVLQMDLLRIVGLNEAPWFKGGATLLIQDTTGRTIALGAGYFPLRHVWAALQPHVALNPEAVVHPSIDALATPGRRDRLA